jgi:pumilio RNA-binding family
MKLSDPEVRRRLVLEGLLGPGPGRVASVEARVLQFALNTHGCHVLQSIFDLAETGVRITVAEKLRGNILACIENPNGNHVIQKCVASIPAPNAEFIAEECKAEALTLAKHVYGCRVLQRLFEVIDPNNECMSQIIDPLVQNFGVLATDPYGNYVLQHIVEFGRPSDKLQVIDQLIRGGIAFYASHKCSANIVEKALTAEEGLVLGNGQQNWFIENLRLACTIVGTQDNENPPLYKMATDKYANYIVQRMQKVCPPAMREMVMFRLKYFQAKLAKEKYTKHILANVDTFMHNRLIMAPSGAAEQQFQPPTGFVMVHQQSSFARAG